ncbi:MAG: flavoprotein [Synergistales bacterium]|nr:flavoprotein [Synergistales bacterium]
MVRRGGNRQPRRWPAPSDGGGGGSLRTAWCVTGAGYLLEESLDLALETAGTVTLFASGAGAEVLAMYGLTDRVRSSGLRYVADQAASAPSCGAMSLGRYDRLVIAPATANTVAKCAQGIADTLPTNLFAQAGKAGVPSCVLPTDNPGEVETKDPGGHTFRLCPRAVDLRNRSLLADLPLVEVVDSVERLRRWLRTSS